MLRVSIKNKLNTFGVLFISITLFLFTCFYFYNYIFPDTINEVIKLSTGWNYFTDHDAIQKDLPTLGNLSKVKPNETLYLTRTLSEHNKSVLMVKNNYQQISVYIDDTKVLEAPLGVDIHFISLPETIHDSELRIEILSPYPQYAGQPAPVYQGDIPSLYKHILSEAFFHLFFMFASTISGFFFIVTFIFAYRKKQVQWDSFFLESFLFCGASFA